MQKTLTLIITAAILYMLFQYNLNHVKSPESRYPTNNTNNNTHKESNQNPKSDNNPELSGGFIEKTLSGILINVLKTEEGREFLENLVTPLDQPISGSGHGYKMNNDMLISNMMKIKTFGNVKGGSASCGHLVTVNYRVISMSGILLSEKTETFPLGSKHDLPGLDAVIVGMYVGQTRHATIPVKLVDTKQVNSKNIYKIEVELKNILPQNFVDNSAKIYDDEIAYGLPLLCGQNVVYDAKIIKLSDGTILFDSKEKGTPISMEIGNQIYPVIFSHALHNKIPVGTRTIIANGRLFKSYVDDNSPIFKEYNLNNNEYYMLEITNIKRPDLNQNVINSDIKRQLPQMKIQ